MYRTGAEDFRNQVASDLEEKEQVLRMFSFLEVGLTAQRVRWSLAQPVGAGSPGMIVEQELAWSPSCVLFLCPSLLAVWGNEGSSDSKPCVGVGPKSATLRSQV